MVDGVAAGYVKVMRAYYGRLGGFVATDGRDHNPVLVQLRRYFPTVQDSFTPFCELQGREVRPPLPVPYHHGPVGPMPSTVRLQGLWRRRRVRAYGGGGGLGLMAAAAG
jgi:hypothetical protein